MKKLALCVGLNYPGTNAQLSGCVNDMTDWTAVLMERGYTVRPLAEPTKAELVLALEDLIAQARYRDRVVFTFSGHGTWIPDLDGDEADGRDEALCCRDFAAGGVLTDDELHTIFGAARFGVRRLIVSDSCHSGSVSRFSGYIGKPTPGGDLGVAIPRFLPPINVLAPEDVERAERVENTTARSVPRKGTVLISGCGDLEYSYDASFGGRPNGALTRVAIDALSPAGVSPSVAEWYRQIRKRLPSGQYPQTPQLTAARHQRRWSPL